MLFASHFGGNPIGGTPIDGPQVDPCKDDNVQMCCPSQEGASSEEPISYYDGSERLSYADLTVRGVYPIVINRRYDSAATYDSPLGYGWAFQHDRRLFEYPNGSVVIRSGCGKRNRFEFTGGSFQKPRDGVQAALTENPDGTFELRAADGSRDVYDQEGRLVLTENRYGQRHEFLYDAAGLKPLTGTSPYAVDPNAPMTVAYVYQLTRIQERGKDGALTGHYVDFSYDPTTGRLASVTASDGRTVTYQHDALNGLTRGNLIQVNGLENIVQSFDYTDPFDAHNVTHIYKHANATPVINAYNSQDRVVQQDYGLHHIDFNYVVDYIQTVVTETIKDDAGAVLHTAVSTYDFDEAGYLTQITDPLGHQLRHIYDANKDRVRTEVWEKHPDDSLELLQATDNTYDGMARKLTETVTLDSGEVITRTWTYDQGWMASEEVVSDQDLTKLFRTEYTFYYDSNGQPTNIASIKQRMDVGSFITTNYAYDALGRLETTTLPDGVALWNEYTGAYRTRTYYKDNLGTELDYLERRFDHDANGNRTKVWDARDNLTEFAYDDLGRVIQITNAFAEETHYTYIGPNLTEVEQGRTVAEGEGQVTKFIYNGKDRQIEVQRKDDGGTFQSFQTIVHNSRGAVIRQTDTLSRTMASEYDAKGQLTAIIDPLSNRTEYEYDAAGNQNVERDALQRETHYQYDDLNRQVQIVQQGVSLSAVTQMTYDAAGNLTSFTDPENNTHVFTYDALSRRTQEKRPLGEAFQFGYDDRGRLTYKINARDQRIEYEYDDWGGVTEERHYSDSTGTNLLRTRTYAYNLDGQPTVVSDNAVQAGDLYTTTYDALGRPEVNFVKYIPGGDISLTYGYDRYGNRNALTLDDGTVVNYFYTFDKRNRLASATLPGTHTVTYSEADERETLTFPNGITTTWTYSSAGPIDTISTRNSAQNTLESWDYSHNAVLNIEGLTTTEGLTNYGYDGLDRLTDATYPLSSPLIDELYEYDLVGNREDPGDPSSWEYDGNNQINASPDVTYAFDADGNLINRSDGAILAYDVTNRLISFVGAATGDYQYEPAGRRISKTINGTQTTWFLWDGTQLLAEYDNAGNRTKRYGYLPGDYAPITMEDANGAYAVHSDHLQTPKLMTDGIETIVWTNQMQAFGRATVTEDPDGNAADVIFNIRFPGQYSDAESGLHYNHFRDYDPSLGRYVESDPIGLTGGVNTYLYALASPVNLSDRLGLQTFTRTGRRNTPINPGLNFPAGNNRRGPLSPTASLNRSGIEIAEAIAGGAEAANEVAAWAMGLDCYGAIGKAVAAFQLAYYEALSRVDGGCKTQYCAVCLQWKSESFGCGSVSAFFHCGELAGVAVATSPRLSVACYSFEVSGRDTGLACRNCN
jgi:RHS repeat-associated protein